MKMLAALFVVLSVSSAAQAAQPSPREVIARLAGCYDVTYRFVEDGANDYALLKTVEYVGMKTKDGTMSLQHIGVFDGEAFKHWREEWSEQAGGVWLQRVYGPFDDFRYECAAPFEFNQWRCLAKNAGKPRRDEKRKDYDTLDRENTLQITPKGWVQNEVNMKRTKAGVAVANELGWVEYTRTDEAKCAAALKVTE